MLATDPECANVLNIKQRGAESPILTLASITDLAWQECRSKLEAALAAFSLYIGTSGSEAHIAAVLNTGIWGFGTRARLQLSQIISSDTYYADCLSPLEQWVTYVALRRVFQTAADRFSEEQGDRYAKKETRYAERAKQLWNQIISQGLPFTAAYLDCPGSRHGWQSGIWDATCLSQSVDSNNTNAVPQEIRLAITYYDASVYISPSAKQNAESGPSATLSTVIDAGSLLSVSIASLNPPSKDRPPNVGTSQGVVPRLNASHWQIYAGIDAPGQPLYLQVPSVPVSQKTATLPAVLLAGGPQLGKGANPDSRGNCLFSSVLVRG